MPLDKAMRTVLFHKGIADGTDRFLLEPPSIDYAENLTLGKDGSFSKRQGNELVSTVTGASGQPMRVHAIGDRLFVFTENGVKTWVPGGAWETVDGPGFLGVKNVTCETLSQHGISAIQYAPVFVAGVLFRHVIAYELMGADRIVSGTPETIDSDVVIAYFTSDGEFVEQKKISGAFSPRFSVSEDHVFVWLWYLKNDPALSEAQAKIFFRTGIGVLEQEIDTTDATDVVTGYPLFNRRDEFRDGERVGQAENYSGKYAVTSDPEHGHMVLARQLGGAIRLHMFDRSTGALLHFFTLNNAVDGTATVFDIHGSTNVSGTGKIHVLYAMWDTAGTGSAPYKWALKYSTVSISALTFGSIDTYDIETGTSNPSDATNNPRNTAFAYLHGTLCGVGDTQRTFIAVTDGGFTSYSESVDPKTYLTNLWNNRHPVAGAKTWVVDWAGTTVRSGVVRGHRVATRAFYNYDESTWYVGFQQWGDYTPHLWDPTGTPTGQTDWTVDDFLDLGPAYKPVTTVICSVKLGATALLHRPVAALDQGQVCDYAQSEVRTQLLDLYRHPSDPSRMYASNRVVIGPFDSTFYAGAISTTLGARPERRPGMLLTANAFGRVHEIQRGVTDANHLVTAEFGDGFFANTSVPIWFDSSYAAEASPLDSPEILGVDEIVNAVGGHDIEKYTYIEQCWNVAHGGTADWEKYVVVLGYTDTHGNAHRSAPSTTLYVRPYDRGGAFSGLAGVRTVYVTPPLSILPASQSYWCELYYADNAENDPQLVSVDSYPTDGNWQTIEMSAGGRIYNQFLAKTRTDYETPRNSKTPYTTGNVLAADPWVTLGKAVVTSTRVWSIDANNPGRVIASKLFEDYIAPEYNPTLAINLGDERNLTAIGKLDDKVIVFEPDDIHVIYGDGPDNRGEGQEFAVHYVSTDVGCSDQKSIIETPAGLLFYSSPRGFYLLDRNLQIQFVGDAVEDIARGIRVKAATIDPANAEVRFLVEPDPDAAQTSRYGPDADTTVITRPPRPVFGNALPEDACLVFYYETGDWMLYTNYPGEAACIYQRRYTRILDDWSVWQESDTSFRDPTGTNRTLLRSPWIKLGETIQNYQRLWRISFLGRYLSSLQDLGGGVYEAGDIIIRLYFDYEALPSQERRERIQDLGFNIFDTTQARAERFQFEVEPRRGRCQAVKIEIEEVNSEDLGEGLTYELGAGFEIVAADLFIGVDTQRALLPSRVKS